ncbi:MAG: type II toxin-antitoxin system VapC family toxin [Methylovulum sp.]|nr:MAG: type II toxin-antitoxin system VapC family toxin [Methylovulum sp.]
MVDVVIIDTDILIDISRNNEKAIVHLENLETNSLLAVSLITQMELLVGCRNKQEAVFLDKFLKRFQIIKLNENISMIAVDLLRQYRLSHGLLMPDALIAATALSLGSGLATKNQRDYQFIENLNLLTF